MSEPTIIRDAVVLHPQGRHDWTIIFLHGLGGSGENFIGMFQNLRLPNTRIVLPTAPSQFVNVTGRVMPAWYNILKFGANRSFDGDQDEASVVAGSDLLLSMIDYEAAKVGGYKRVFIGGFSQGCSLSLATALRCPHELGGVISSSGYCLLAFLKEKLVKTKTTPIVRHISIPHSQYTTHFTSALALACRFFTVRSFEKALYTTYEIDSREISLMTSAAALSWQTRQYGDNRVRTCHTTLHARARGGKLRAC